MYFRKYHEGVKDLNQKDDSCTSEEDDEEMSDNDDDANCSVPVTF